LLATLLTARLAGAEQSTGGIYVATLPAGADVWIDGTYVGRSPVFADALPLGHHTLTITKTGWTVREVDVSIDPRETAFATVRLSAKATASSSEPGGWFALRGLPAGAQVSVDGLPVTGDLHNQIAAAAGLHRVAVTTPRGRTTRTFSVMPETTTEVVLHEPPAGDAARSAVIAPADDYLPTDCYEVEGSKVVVRYARHLVVAHLGDTSVRFDGALVSYAGAPQTIGRKLYLPLELLERLSGDVGSAPAHTH
jgi:hypothetical protein